MVKYHCQLQTAHKGDKIGVLEMRKHAAWYTAGFPGCGTLRAKVNNASSMEEIVTIMDEYLMNEREA